MGDSCKENRVPLETWLFLITFWSTYGRTDVMGFEYLGIQKLHFPDSGELTIIQTKLLGSFGKAAGRQSYAHRQTVSFGCFGELRTLQL